MDDTTDNKRTTKRQSKIPTLLKIKSAASRQKSLLNAKMINEYEIQSPTTKFLNQGELRNYLAFKFIAAIQIIFEHGEFTKK